MRKIAPIPDRNSHDPRWNELGKYIRSTADAMGLTEWYFTLSRKLPSKAEHDDEETVAEVYITSQTVEAIFAVGDVFWTKLNRYEQRWRVVHELLHVVESPYVNAISEGFEATPTVKAVVNQLRERFIDQVSLMLSRRFKLPPKGFMPPVKKKRKKVKR